MTNYRLVGYCNELIEDCKNSFVRRLLGDDVTIGKLRFEIPYFPVKVSVTKGLDSSKLMAAAYSTGTDILRLLP